MRIANGGTFGGTSTRPEEVGGPYRNSASSPPDQDRALFDLDPRPKDT